MADTYLGFDVGGQSIKGVVVDAEARVVAAGRRPTERETTLELLVETIAALISELNGDDKPVGVGLGIAGVVGRDGVLHGCPNLPHLLGTEIGASLSKALEMHVVVENDANCAAYAEGWRGAADGVSHYLVATIGTGLGSGVVLDGRLYRGATGFASELGHTVVVAGGRRCGCGNLGCLEAYASETAMRSLLGGRDDAVAAAVRERVAAYGQGHTRALVALAADEATAPAVRSGAAALFDDMIRMLGIGLASAINLLDLETVVLTGGIAPAVLERIDVLRDAMSDSLFARPIDRVAIVPSLHGDDAGAIGAARLVSDPL